MHDLRSDNSIVYCETHSTCRSLLQRHDALDRLSRLTQTGSGLSDKRVDFTYNAVGQFQSINRNSDLAGTQLVVGSAYAYDTLNRLSSITHNNAAAPVAFYNFTYDSASRITQIADIDGATNYAYDATDQLTAADHSAASIPDESYVYDANGNRVRTNLHATGYIAGPGNRLLSDGTYNYAYDNEGNLITRARISGAEADGSTLREFTWDYRNRLIAVTDKIAAGVAIQRVTFSYDVLDRRISKAVDTTPQDAVDAVVTHFIYDREDVILDFVDSDGSGPIAPVLSKRYLHGPGVDQVLAQDDGAGGVEWLLADHLGTVRDLVNNSGALVNHFTYDSFGTLVSATNAAIHSRYLFSGRELDVETNIYYFRARYFIVALGRFISEDPVSFAGEDLNLYRYASNRPNELIDSYGLCPFSPENRMKAKKDFDRDVEKAKRTSR